MSPTMAPPVDNTADAEEAEVKDVSERQALAIDTLIARTNEDREFFWQTLQEPLTAQRPAR